MKKRIVFSLGFLLLLACAEKLIEKPDKLIPEDKMVSILKEIAIVNAAKTTNQAKLRDNAIEPTTFVFEKYEVDSAQFVDSDRYYASLPMIYERLYKRVETSLENERLQMEEDKRRMDSLDLIKNTVKDSDSMVKDTIPTTKTPQ